MQRFPFIAKLLLCAAAASLIAACSSGSGSGSGATPPSKVTVSGVAAKGIVSNGIITIYSIERPTAIEPNGEGAAPAESNVTDVAQPDYQGYWARAPINEATARTDDKGSYSLVLTNINGPVLVELTADEATQLVCDIKECADNDGVEHSFGDKYTAPSDFKLSAIYNIEATSKKIRLPITPLTTIAEKNSQFQAEKYPGLAIAATIDMGNSHVQNVFNLAHAPTSVLPIDITKDDMPDPVTESGLSLEQSIISAAFLAMLANSAGLDKLLEDFSGEDLDKLLEDFSGEDLEKNQLVDLNDQVINNVIEAIKKEETGNPKLRDAAQRFQGSYSPSKQCYIDGHCTFVTPFPSAIQSNLDKAKSLVSNTQHLMGVITAIRQDAENETPTDTDLQVFNKSAAQLQEGAGHISEAIGNVVTFISYYREAVLNGLIDQAELEGLNLVYVDPKDQEKGSLVSRICDVYIADPEEYEECRLSAAQFDAADENGTIARNSTAWTLSKFSYNYKGELCSIAAGNKITIDLPNHVKLLSDELDKGIVTASIKGDMRHLTCPEENVLAKRTQLRINDAATIKFDLREKIDFESEDAKLNSYEIQAEQVSLTSGDFKNLQKPHETINDISFSGGLHLKAVRSQNYADLNNGENTLFPEVIKLNGEFIASQKHKYNASVNMHFKNAASYAFMNGNIRKDLASYHYKGEGADQQLLITVNPPEGGAYSYVYRIAENADNNIELVHVAGAANNEEQRVISVISVDFDTTKEIIKVLDSAEACEAVQGKNEPVIDEDGNVVGVTCTYIINPDFDLRQVFNPEQDNWNTIASTLFDPLLSETIIIREGEYRFHDGIAATPNLSDASNTEKPLPVYTQSTNHDVDLPNRYLMAETEVIVKGQRISKSLPLIDIKMTTDRTGYRDGNLTLNLQWKDTNGSHKLNAYITVNKSFISKATIDDSSGTVFTISQLPNTEGCGNCEFEAKVERDGTIYGRIEGLNIKWLDDLSE